ncbi:MAG: HAMP domain-containing protein, partial [Myxococcales bacterium]|nr:HAMP domain-containing protein [Myxococcales bacterium]
QPFIGDEYELRPGVKATFEGAGAGAEGPYEDAHGAWISAWAPIFDARGEVIAVVQADYSLEALLMARTNQALGLLFFGLVGVAVALFAALLLAQGIARPILAVVDAARRLGGGDFEVRVHESGATEVRALSEAINQMANGLAERERIRSLFGRYVAGQVADHLLTTSHIEFAGEQRLVTVMISDIRGFTALTEALGAREIVALLNEYFSLLVDEVVRLEGVIDKFMGDAMLSWFGAPQPQPDHDQRTVDAAAAIMRRLDRWNADRAAQSLPPVPTGIGIARGEVVVGNIGSPQRLEYTAIGDAVNLASRLCSQAKAGEVLISDEVRRAVDAPTEDVGFIEVKGVAEPVHVHRLRWRQE